jgi:peptide deformylase
MANPELVAVSDEMRAHDEASPNLPGVHAKLLRPARVSVSFIDHHGMRVRQEFEALWATSVQHQIDHLNGKMYFDRLSKMKRDMLLRKAKKGAR